MDAALSRPHPAAPAAAPAGGGEEESAFLHTEKVCFTQDGTAGWFYQECEKKNTATMKPNKC